MTGPQITIRMPAAKLKLWLRALRLKKNANRQARGALYKRREGRKAPAGYCCLGVAQQVLSGGIECGGSSTNVGNALSFPSKEWRDKEGVEFFGADGSVTNDPYLPMFGCTASVANDGDDSCGYTFKEIADAIEDCAVGY